MVFLFVLCYNHKIKLKQKDMLIKQNSRKGILAFSFSLIILAAGLVSSGQFTGRGIVPTAKAAAPVISDFFPDYICAGGDVVIMSGSDFDQAPFLTPLFNNVFGNGGKIDNVTAQGWASSLTPGMPGNVPLKMTNVPQGGSLTSNSVSVNVRKAPIITAVTPLYSDRNNPLPLTFTIDPSTPLLTVGGAYSFRLKIFTGAGVYTVAPTALSDYSFTIAAPFQSNYMTSDGSQSYYPHGNSGVGVQTYNNIPGLDPLYAARSAFTFGNNTICTSGTIQFKFNPYLENMSATSGSAGDIITVNGTDFKETLGGTTYEPVVVFGATVVTPEAGPGMTQLKFKVPSLAAGTYPVRVRVNGRLSSNSINFTIAAPATYTMTVLRSGSGAVTSVPAGVNCGLDCNETYANGTSVTLTATAPPMWNFVSWVGGGCSGSVPTCTVTMDGNKMVQAFFSVTPILYDINVTKAGLGSGYVTDHAYIDCGATCSDNLANGTAFAFEATPAVGSVFTGWSGGGCSGTGICNVMLNANTTVTATFTFTPTFTLSATDPANGKITSSGGVGLNLNCGLLPCSVVKNSGDAVSINAVPDVGYYFLNWGPGVCFGQVNPCSLTMNANKGPITATFAFGIPATYTLTASAPANGSIASDGLPGEMLNCGATCSVNKLSGTTVTVTAVPASGFVFSSWGAGACFGQGNPCTVTMTSNINVGTATFVVGVPPVIATSGDPLNPCWDILYSGKQVLVNGTPNSGIMQFDAVTGWPEQKYQACLWAPGNDATVKIYAKGWFWDTNLGWISMYCGDEDNNAATPYTNLNVLCGNFEYGVWMDGYGQATRGRLHGYAWGDNVGYISFNCLETGTCAASSYYLQPDVTTDPWNALSTCTGFVNVPGCAPTGAGVSHGWADSVGWIDFSGVRFPWFQLIDAPVLVTMTINPDPALVTKITAPYGDGNASYQMNVKMNKLDGTAIDPTKYSIDLVPTWSLDSVSLDQTAAAAVDCKTAVQGWPCAVSKPLSFTNFGGAAGYGATVPMSFTGNVKSYAPTSSMNGYDKAPIDGAVDFRYETFIVKPTGLTLPPSHSLVFGNMQAEVVRTADGLCSFGTIAGGACLLKNVGTGGQNFGFRPAIEVTTLTDSVNGESIAATYLTPNNLTYGTTCLGAFAGCPNSSVEFRTSVANDDFEIVFDDDAEGAECKDPNTVTMPGTIPGWSGMFSFTPVFTDSGATCLESGDATGKDPTVYTVVKQGAGANMSTYYSNKLPRKTGSLVYNPVADVKGSIYSTGVSNPQTNVAYRSIGDVSTNILRETIVRNVYNLIGGAEGTSAGVSDVTISGFNAATGFTGTNMEKIKLLQPDQMAVPKVYYSNANKVTFENPAGPTIDWRGERTFIVIGADVYIKSNLYVAPGTWSPKPKLGLIVLKDEKFQTGGNIYIAPNVTDIQANIYADGSIFSYVPANGISAAAGHVGEPIFTDDQQRRTALINQLYIEGSIASQNTIGGAVYVSSNASGALVPTPILGDGTVEPGIEGGYGASPNGVSRARLYDLNFLRYFGLVYERMPAGSGCEGEAKDQQNPTYCPSTPGYEILDKPVLDGGDLVMNPAGQRSQALLSDPKAYAPEYIKFDPPTGTLPGFGFSTGAEVKIGPQ
jgi:hypothetical protein